MSDVLINSVATFLIVFVVVWAVLDTWDSGRP